MKQLAQLSLFFGLGVIGISLVIAAATLDSVTSDQSNGLAVSDCLFCSVDPHQDWNVVSVPNLQMDAINQMDSSGTQCSDCHAMETVDEKPVSDDRAQIVLNQARIARLRVQLSEVQTHHPEWQQNITRSEKPEAQIIAEQVEVIISVLEADGSWGFHDLDYTDMQLSEAEDLFVTLQAALG